ncbi:MAG TPA: type II toxin-antitoxin system Phd/YefM family antitoxin [Acidimicrobiales bacterium]
MAFFGEGVPAFEFSWPVPEDIVAAEDRPSTRDGNRQAVGPIFVADCLDAVLSEFLLSKYLPTLLAMDELPLADARNRLSELVAEVEKTHARVTITKHGHPAAVLVSPQDLASLEETLDILSDPEALAGIREAEAEYARGDVTTGKDMARLIGERRRRESGAG